MNADWKLVVEGLGRIKRAEIRPRPMTLLVGENNSGKSYLATLLWGLLARGGDLFPKAPPETPAYKECEAWLSRVLKGRKRNYVLTDEDLQRLLRWWNELLEQNGSSFIRDLFHSSKVDVHRIAFEGFTRRDDLVLRWSSDSIEIGSHSKGRDTDILMGFDFGDRRWKDDRVELLSILEEVAWNAVIGDLGPDMAPHAGDSADAGTPTFLPASRSGFMLVYKAVVRHQIGQIAKRPRGDESALELTAPVIQFLEMLAVGITQNQGPFSADADFLEAGALGGRLQVHAGHGANEYAYRPARSRQALPMALSSSLVTELAPIVLALRYHLGSQVLILEEPEAHLHPHLQRVLAQTLVRLVRKGVHVWVTTHSENFCQQVNNFVRLGESPRRSALQKELGYEGADYLRAEELAGYQFTTEGSHSVVKELAGSPRGLTMPTFNRELAALGKETLRLQRDEEADEP